jgi:hypothetical protein
MLNSVAVSILSLTLSTVLANAQGKMAPANPQQVQVVFLERDAISQRLERNQVARLVIERRAQLRRDTEKLVALTAELKQHVDKTSVDTLSMDVIKKAEEIQKLAKSVQDKMRNPY